MNAHIKASIVQPGSDLTPSDTGIYLEYRTSGYLAGRKLSRSVSEFFDEVRAFYGACLAYGIIDDSPSFELEEVTPILVANSLIDGEEGLAYIDRVEEDITRCANLATTIRTDQRLKDKDKIEDILDPIVPVFSSNNSEKLKTACAWSLRSNLSTRVIDRVLEATIAMEVLLGDRDTSDRIGLSKLMANRCAYALGKTSVEREEIMAFFVKFYKLRSEIVHSGRTNMDKEERSIVVNGIDLANRMLRHEIDIS